MDQKDPIAQKPADPTPVQVPSSSTMDLPKRSGGRVFLVVLIVILVAAAVGGGVWWYMNKRLSDQKAQHQTRIDELNVQVVDLQKQVDEASKTPSVAAGKAIKALYDLWINGTNNNTDKNTMIAESIDKGLVTTELGNSLKAGKVNVLCSVTKPQSYTYAISSATDKKASSVVTISGTIAVNSSGKQAANVDLTASDNNWKVSSINCSTL